MSSCRSVANNDANVEPHSDYRIGTITEGNSYSSIDLCEIIAFDSIISPADAFAVKLIFRKNGVSKELFIPRRELTMVLGVQHMISENLGTGLPLMERR